MFVRRLIPVLLVVLTISLSAISSVHALPDLVLWNKLGSATEVSNSEVGPNGIETGPIVYGPAKFDNGFKPLYHAWSAVEFPSNILSRDRGCIEMWVKPEFDKTLATQWCYLVWQRTLEYSVPATEWSILAAYLGDGWGLTFWMYIGGGMPGDYVCLSWEQPDWEIGDLVHLAFVWDITEEKGFSLAIFRNGEKVASTDADVYGTGTSPGSALWIGNSMYPYSVACNWLGYIDNIKVWNYAKTDFSDRIYEGFPPWGIPEFSLGIPIITSIATIAYLTIRKRISRRE